MACWSRAHFGYVHLGDLHEPIEPPESYAASHDVDTSTPHLETWDDDYVESYGSPQSERYREERLKLYHAAASYVRDTLESFLDDVRDDTLVVLTGDHGEAHWEQVELAREFTDSRPAHGVATVVRRGTPSLAFRSPSTILTTGSRRHLMAGGRRSSTSPLR